MARKRKSKVPLKVESVARREIKRTPTTITEGNPRWVSLTVISGFILLFSLITITAFLQKSPTYDEAYHVLAGYSHLKWGDFRVYPEHPPLAKVLAALPLLALDIKDPRSSTPYWDIVAENRAHSWALANQMIFKENDAETLFFHAKLPMILLGIILGVFVYLWAKELFGVPAGFAALFLYGLDPNILAHSPIAQTDIAFSAFFFIGAYFFWRCLRRLTWRDLLWTSLFCGFATITKFSFFNIFLIWFVVALIKILSSEAQSSSIILPGEIRNRGGKAILLAVILCCAALVSYACIWAAYRFRWDAVPNGSVHFPLAPVMPESPFPQAIINWISNHYLFPEAWVYGVLFVFKFLKRPAYLLGEISTNGFWLYFPVAFVVKTPLPTLLLLLAAIGIWIFRRRMRMPECFLLIHVLIYFSIAVVSGINIGLRHILPIYPFLFVLLGGAASEMWNAKRHTVRGALLLLGLWYIWSFIHIHPHYLAYFNELVGGPKNGYKILVDSNLDWGQDLKGLKIFMESKGIKQVYLSYFGTADTCYYRINFTYLPASPLPCEQKPTEASADFLAISATNLQAVYFSDRDSYKWLKDYQPIAQIGYSILVYDIKGDMPAHNNLGMVYLKFGMLEDAIREFEMVAQSAPKNQTAYTNLGNDAALYLNFGTAYLRKGLPDKALEQYKQAVRIKPDYPEAHSNLGVVYASKNQIDEAIKEFSTALQIDSNNAEAHNNLGSAYTKKGLLDKAIEQYQQAITLKPDYSDAQNNLRAVLQQKSQSGSSRP